MKALCKSLSIFFSHQKFVLFPGKKSIPFFSATGGSLLIFMFVVITIYPNPKFKLNLDLSCVLTAFVVRLAVQWTNVGLACNH